MAVAGSLIYDTEIDKSGLNKRIKFNNKLS